MKRSHFLAAGSAFALSPHAAAAASLGDRVQRIAASVPGSLGVVCRPLGEGPPLYAYNANERFPTASTIKVLIMTTAFTVEEREPGTLERTIVTRRKDLIGGSDFMATVPDGRQFTVRELLEPMIQVSDNTASNALIDFFGVQTINDVGAAAGMTRTRLARKFLDYSAIVHHNDNVTTPADMASLLYQIERGAREAVPTVVSAKHCRRMVDILLGQTDRDGIPAGLPRGAQVANKTGEIDGTRNDVAIVEPFGESPYVLAIFSKNVRDYAAAYAAIHRLAALSYGALKGSQL